TSQASSAGHEVRRRTGAVCLTIAANARKAALTESEFGNTSVISGSRITTFELCRSRAAYLPRTSVVKSERLYSRRSSSAGSVLPLFIELPLRPGSFPGADDSDGIVCLYVRYDKKASG